MREGVGESRAGGHNEDSPGAQQQFNGTARFRTQAGEFILCEHSSRANSRQHCQSRSVREASLEAEKTAITFVLQALRGEEAALEWSLKVSVRARQGSTGRGYDLCLTRSSFELVDLRNGENSPGSPAALSSLDPMEPER